jgi:hypothetical protein
LDRKAVQVDIHKLGFFPDTLDRFLGLMAGVGGKKNFGIVLVCGPTGSGKSTTLYASLNHINRPDIKILTAENPVEYNLDGIVQIQVNPDLKLGEDKVFDFATALRSFLRLDPDVIMVGEIRDKETAHIAMEAAMTGHLVFSTIHTNDAVSTVTRLGGHGHPGLHGGQHAEVRFGATALSTDFARTAKPRAPPRLKKWKSLKPTKWLCLRGRRFIRGRGAERATALGLKDGWGSTNCWSLTTLFGEHVKRDDRRFHPRRGRR